MNEDRFDHILPPSGGLLLNSSVDLIGEKGCVFVCVCVCASASCRSGVCVVIRAFKMGLFLMDSLSI